ncbi:predicted protein [Streptomyces viridochromogenes DSM 40736]|uniref:Predicted protein n=2 Tax=Streptomyces viridochromogenes TaxID=1938 RepID=D9WZC1_STRVT|nr:predicted protein [Streptomyces viridochromogenes DSM 40736]
MLGTGTAQAADKYCTLAENFRAGQACFYSYGDKLTVTDMLGDGYRTVSVWKLTDRANDNKVIRTGECHNYSGAGTTKTCNYNFPEGTYGASSRYLIIFSSESRNGPYEKTGWVSNVMTGYVSGR